MGHTRNDGFRWQLSTTVDETMTRIANAGVADLVFDGATDRFRLRHLDETLFEPRQAYFEPRSGVSARSPILVDGSVQPDGAGATIAVELPSPWRAAWPAVLAFLWPLTMLLVTQAWSSFSNVAPFMVAPLALFASALVRRRRELQQRALASLTAALDDVRRIAPPAGPYR